MRRRLVIHLDVNETMILGDPAGGDSFEDSLNKIVCKQAIVRRVAPAQKPVVEQYAWADGRPLGNAEGEAPALHSWDVPEGCVRFYEQPELKQLFAKTFCTGADSPGRTYSGLHRRLEAAMRRGDETDPRLVRGDYHFVLPAVWRFLESLAAERFTLVIRTFGSDLVAVAAALAAFAERQKGPLARLGLDRNSLYTLRRDGDSCVVRPIDGGETLNELQLLSMLEEDDVPVRCVGISDDYASWKAAGYDPSAGKPLWITKTARHIFFDDNIHNNPADSIAAVRYVDGSSILPLDGRIICALQGLVLVRVPTIEPILDEMWFVRKLRQVAEKIARLSAAAAAEAEPSNGDRDDDDDDDDAAKWFLPWLVSTGLVDHSTTTTHARLRSLLASIN